MADDSVEIIQPPGPPDKPVDRLPLPEDKGRTINQSLTCFDRVTEGARQLRFADQKFVGDAKFDVTRLRVDVSNASPREVGYRQAIESTDEIVGFISPKLEGISKEADMLGVRQEPHRAEIEALLKQAVTETDPIKVFALAQDAVEIFNRTTQELTDKREEQKGVRGNIGRVTQENEARAKSLYHRVATETKQNLQGGLLHRFTLNSDKLAETVRVAIQSLSAEDRKFLEKTGQNKIVFQKLVEELIK